MGILRGKPSLGVFSGVFINPSDEGNCAEPVRVFLEFGGEILVLQGFLTGRVGWALAKIFVRTRNFSAGQVGF